jgi:hypothetical protein
MALSRSSSLPYTRFPVAAARAASVVLLVMWLASCGMSDRHDAGGGDRGADALAIVIVGAETMTPPGTFDVVQDASAFTGVYVEHPLDVQASAAGVETANVAVEIAEEGEYSLWVRMFGSDRRSDAIYVGFDGVMSRVFTSTHGSWEWVRVVRTDLASGARRISVGYGEPGVRIDVFAIVADDSVGPGELESVVMGTEPGAPPAWSPVDGELSALSLRGDPSFSRSALSVDERAWYDALLGRIASPAGDFDPLVLAGRDDVYGYGRTLHTYVQSVLLAFRVTGDLRLLDHVDAIAEVMRGELRDGWRDTLDGTDGTRDGYLNWVFRYGNSTTYQGKDTHQLNEMRTHSLVATIAYALHLNRDLASPGGRDYGAHADFWTDYLVNHFEAKWRERRDVPTGFPIMIRPHTHTYYSWAKWHYYMGLLTGDGAYTVEAERMAGVLQAELRTVSTASGTAYVWARSVLAEGGGDAFLHPTTYARYVYADIVEFHLEGFHFWADPTVMDRFARTVTDLVVDTPDPVRNEFAADIGGGESLAGLSSDPSWSRLSVHRYAISSYAHISAWDTTLRLGGITADIHHIRNDRDSDTTHLLGALLLNAHLQPSAAAAANP